MFSALDNADDNRACLEFDGIFLTVMLNATAAKDAAGTVNTHAFLLSLQNRRQIGAHAAQASMSAIPRQMMPNTMRPPAIIPSTNSRER